MKELVKIQSELNAPKSQRNTFGNYNYRSTEDILSAVKPLLLREECYLKIEDDIIMVGDRFYVKATATISKGDISISTSAFARESLDKKGMDSAQITGATSSYARKYALNGLFAIDDEKDADHDKPDNRKEKANGDVIPEDNDKEWFNLDNWEKFKLVDYEFSDPTEAIKKARKYYKCSNQWAYKMEDYYRTGEDKPLNSYPKK